MDNNLNQFRSAFMAIGELLVIWHHCDLRYNNRLVRVLKSNAWFGVDMLIYASGIGCYTSYCRTADPGLFFWRRVKKLFPSYFYFLLVWIPYQIKTKHIQLPAIVGNVFCIQYWIRPQLAVNWYIQGIWLFYLMTPLLTSVIKRINTPATFFSELVVLIFALYPFHFGTSLPHLSLRLPCFFSGMYFCSYINKYGKLSNCSLFTVGTIHVLGLLIFYSCNPGKFKILQTLYWRPFCFAMIVPGLYIIVHYILSKLQRSPVGKTLIHLLTHIGNLTLELYLIHILLFDIHRYLIGQKVIQYNASDWRLSLILVIPLSLLLHLFAYGKLSPLSVLFQKW